MTSVKRNDPCPCGSGKKFKKCCGGAKALMRLSRSQTSRSNTVRRRPGQPVKMSLPMALHGQNQYVVFEPLPGPIPVGGGEAGTYKVVFTLSRPGFPLRPEGEIYLRAKP